MNVNSADKASKKIAMMRLKVLPVWKKATRFKTAMINMAAIMSLFTILTLPKAILSHHYYYQAMSVTTFIIFA